MSQAKSILLFLFITHLSIAQEFITTWNISSNTTSIGFEATTTGTVSYTWETLPPAAAASGSGTFQGPDVTISGLPTSNQDQSILLKIQPQNFKRFITGNTGSPTYLLKDINQWGDV